MIQDQNNRFFSAATVKTEIGKCKEPAVFIIILNWNGLHDTTECLKSIEVMDYTNYKVVVVDNGSNDNSVEILRQKFPFVSVIANSKNLGYTGGNNAGIRHALENNSDYVWLVNNDTTVERETLRQLVRVAEDSPSIGLVSPVIYFYDHPEKVQFCGSYFDWSSFSVVHYNDITLWKHESQNQPVALWGTALLVKRSVINAVGLLNDEYFAYHEDCELSLRALKAGFTNIVNLHARIYHKDSQSTGSRKSRMQAYLRMRNYYFLWIDHLKKFRKATFIRHYIAYTVAITANLIRNGWKEAASACLDGAWAAVRGKGGPWNDSVRMPRYLKKAFIWMATWHPYLWVGIIRGHTSYIISEGSRRVINRVRAMGRQSG